MIFISIVVAILTIYGLANYYICVRGLHALRPIGTVRAVYVVAFIFLAISYIASVFLERADIIVWGKPLSWIGSFWIGAFVYFLLIVAAIDLLRLINHFLPFFPAFITSNPARSAFTAAIVVISIVAVVLVYGFINAHIIRVRTFDITIAKEAGKRKTLNIVMASDIHLSSIIGRSRIKSIVEKINSLSPDLVLLPGNIVDGDLNPVIHQNLGESLRQIRAPLGVFAITGNHEYIGGVERACKYITDHGVKMLRDTSVFVDESFYIVGRIVLQESDARSKNSWKMSTQNIPSFLWIISHFTSMKRRQTGLTSSFQDIHIMGKCGPLIISPIWSMSWLTAIW